MRILAPGLAAGLIALAGPLAGQTILSGNHSITGDLCTGADCTGSESFAFTTLKLKEADIGLLFEDTTSSPFYASQDWLIDINDKFSNAGYFAIEDVDGAGALLHLEAGSKANALYVSANGNVGFGTANPTAELHVVSGDRASLLLDQDGSGGFAARAWRLDGRHTGFELHDPGSGTLPFIIRPGSGNHHALTIDGNGHVGIGVLDGAAQLHVRNSDGSAKALIEETSGSTGPRTLLEMKNNGRPEIVMANTGSGGEWSFGAGTNFVLKQGAVGTTSAAKTKYFTLKAGSGDLEITGQIITGGSTCGSGCDAVFSNGYELPSIAEHTEAMYALGYLPNVGPTLENTPINVSDKLGRMLNELETAHIYIAKLEARLAVLEAAAQD